jgi:tetratricopeptide (TPR) repeat protein
LLNEVLAFVHVAHCKYIDFILKLLKELKEKSQIDILDTSLTHYLVNNGDLDAALHLAEERNDPYVWYSYAVALCESGNSEEAIEYFKRTIELDSTGKPVWSCLLKCLRASGRDEEYERTKDEAIKQFGSIDKILQEECPD